MRRQNHNEGVREQQAAAAGSRRQTAADQASRRRLRRSLLATALDRRNAREVGGSRRRSGLVAKARFVAFGLGLADAALQSVNHALLNPPLSSSGARSLRQRCRQRSLWRSEVRSSARDASLPARLKQECMRSRIAARDCKDSADTIASTHSVLSWHSCPVAFPISRPGELCGSCILQLSGDLPVNNNIMSAASSCLSHSQQPLGHAAQARRRCLPAACACCLRHVALPGFCSRRPLHCAHAQ